jgi:hypothetical protein
MVGNLFRGGKIAPTHDNMKMCVLESERHVLQINMKHFIPHAAREGMPCHIQFFILAFSDPA